LILLPSHTSTHLQPLDKEVFGKFKRNYAQRLSHFFAFGPVGSHFTVVSQMYLAWSTWMDCITPEIIKSSWRSTGLVPLDAMRVLSWSVERSVQSKDLIEDLNKIRDLCLNMALGNEVATMNEIFLIATNRGPIFKLLYDQAQKVVRETCPTCHRKTKQERPLSILHKGCRLTAEEMRNKVQEAIILRKQKAAKKLDKENKKEYKALQRSMAQQDPFDTNWDPEQLTTSQIQAALRARTISFKPGGRKEIYVQMILDSNRCLISSLSPVASASPLPPPVLPPPVAPSPPLVVSTAFETVSLSQCLTSVAFTSPLWPGVERPFPPPFSPLPGRELPQNFPPLPPQRCLAPVVEPVCSSPREIQVSTNCMNRGQYVAHHPPDITYIVPSPLCNTRFSFPPRPGQ